MTKLIGVQDKATGMAVGVEIDDSVLTLIRDRLIELRLECMKKRDFEAAVRLSHVAAMIEEAVNGGCDQSELERVLAG